MALHSAYANAITNSDLSKWTSIDQILGIDLNAARGRPSIALRVRENLLTEDRVAELGAIMGEVYEEATRKCIEGGFQLGLHESSDETNDGVAARLSMVFYEDVVKRLGDVWV